MKNNTKFQVWHIDQYNYFEILTILSEKGKPENEWDSLEDAVSAAKRYVNDKNRENPLTFEEQQREWTHAFVELNKGKKYVYSGNLIQSKRTMLSKTKDDYKEEVLDEGLDIRFYLGQKPDGSNWFLVDRLQEEIKDFNHPDLVSKTVVFVHKEQGR